MKPSRGPAGRLYELIAQGEHQQQDFKYKIEDAPKLARSVSAFANTDGGRLLIGVRDDGSIHGVRSEEEIFMMHAAACKYCTPVPTIKFETLHVPTEPHGGRLRTVVICTVMPSDQRPVFALGDTAPITPDKTNSASLKHSDTPRNASIATPLSNRKGNEGEALPTRTAYIRVDDENIVASPVHLAIWRQEQRLRGEAFGDSPAEHDLLVALGAHPEGIPLNALAKEVTIPRTLAITFLARFIRFGLARIERRNQQWFFFPEA